MWISLRSGFLPVKTFRGVPLGGVGSFTFAYIGWDKKIRNYFLTSLFNDHERIGGTKFIPVRKIEMYINTFSASRDLALLEIGCDLSKQYSRKVFGFLLPRWIKMYLDVDNSYELLSSKRNAHRRRIKKYNLEVETGTRTEDFAFFYEKMYKPYIRERHKKSAVLVSYDEMFSHPKLESSRIIFVTHEGQRIAGMYEQFFEGFPYLNAVGVLNGSTEYLKMGGIGAAYVFAIDDYKARHIPRVNLGGTSPLLSDGLTQFKLSLGGKISEPERQDSIRLKLLLLSYSPGLSNYLLNSGFVCFDRDETHVVLFKNRKIEGTDPDFEKQLRHAESIGADHVEILRITP